MKGWIGVDLLNGCKALIRSGAIIGVVEDKDRAGKCHIFTGNGPEDSYPVAHSLDEVMSAIAAAEADTEPF